MDRFVDVLILVAFQEMVLPPAIYSARSLFAPPAVVKTPQCPSGVPPVERLKKLLAIANQLWLMRFAFFLWRYIHYRIIVLKIYSISYRRITANKIVTKRISSMLFSDPAGIKAHSVRGEHWCWAQVGTDDHKILVMIKFAMSESL